jgi:DNA invertase Pin-like site-specific DNA recombinase
MSKQGKNEKQSRNGRAKAVAYLRTSSATNTGADKDSEKRQRLAIAAYAKSARFEIADEDWFYDPAVSGADPIETRPGFNRLLDRIEGNGVRVVIIEDASRFARDLMTQELGILSLIKLGVRVITATGDDLTDTSDPMKKAMRQIAGAFAELEKARLVAKLRGARERKRAEGKRVAMDGRGKCEGRKSLAERSPELIAAAQTLNDGRSLRKIAAGLAEQGFLTPSGKEYSASAVKGMLGGEGSKSRALKRTDAKGRRILGASD